MDQTDATLTANLDQAWALAVDAYLAASPEAVTETIEVLGTKRGSGLGLVEWIGHNPKKAESIRHLANIAMGEILRRAGERLQSEDEDEEKKP
jgi:hypothetical protein